MSASDKRDFTFPLPTHDDAAEGAFATGSVAVQCPQLDPLGLQLERGDGYALRSLAGPAVSIDPEGEWLERVLLRPGQPVHARGGAVFEISDGVLRGRLGAPLRDRSTPGPRLDDPELSLPTAARAAAQEAASVGHGAVAAGLVLRHGQAASLEAILAGRDPVASCVQAWWDGLDETARQDVSTHLLRSAVRITETAEDLMEEADAEGAGWLADVAALCRSRDDLHSAGGALQRLAPEQLPRPALEAADTALRRLLRSVYAAVPHTDPVVRLAARQTACWWARSVGTATPDDPVVSEDDDMDGTVSPRAGDET